MARRKKAVVLQDVQKPIEPEIEIVQNEISVPPKEDNSNKEKEAFIRRIKENALKFDKEYFEKSKVNGCDYSYFGNWQKQYAEMVHNMFNLKDRNVLDIGGAYGALAYAFSLLSPKKVLCTDISKHVIDAKKFKNIEYAVMPMQHMNKIGDGAFDFIHISHVFEHVDEVDHDKCIKEIARILDKAGVCMITGRYKNISALKESFKKYKDCEFVTVSEEQDREFGYFKKYKWDYLIVICR